MTRVLPWLVSSGATSRTAKAPAPRPTKRQPLSNPDSDSDTGPAKDHSRPRKVRTPSTSPPPIRPPQESPLRPGLSKDDIYIMVEDEFLSTAQMFTRHLHHAEYQRLKKGAKERNSSTITSISRPTDGSTRMREELKRKKQGDALHAKAKKGVDSILSNAKRQGQMEDGSQSDFDFQDSDDEPWKGTQLHSFMSASPKQNLKSLMGLQGAKTHTRASAGFGRGGRDGVSENPSRERGTWGTVTMDADETQDEDSDDLDGPVDRPPKPSNTTTAKKVHMQKPSIPPTRRPPAAEKQSPNYRTSDTIPNTHLKENSYHNPSQRASSSDSTAAVRARLKARREREDKEKGKQFEDSNKVEEIPMFL